MPLYREEDLVGAKGAKPLSAEQWRKSTGLSEAQQAKYTPMPGGVLEKITMAGISAVGGLIAAPLGATIAAGVGSVSFLGDIADVFSGVKDVLSPVLNEIADVISPIAEVATPFLGGITSAPPMARQQAQLGRGPLWTGAAPTPAYYEGVTPLWNMAGPAPTAPIRAPRRTRRAPVRVLRQRRRR